MTDPFKPSVTRLKLDYMRDQYRYQTFKGMHTISMGYCGHPARGGGWCKSCLLAEAARRGVSLGKGTTDDDRKTDGGRETK